MGFGGKCKGRERAQCRGMCESDTSGRESEGCESDTSVGNRGNGIQRGGYGVKLWHRLVTREFGYLGNF